MTVSDQRRFRPERPDEQQIAARCPATGESVVTDIACDGESFARISFRAATEACPAYGAPHTWRKSELLG